MEAGLSTRAVNILARVGVRTLDDITLWSRDNLRAIPNAGAKTIADIETVLEHHGLSLAQSGGPPPTTTTGPIGAAAASDRHSGAITPGPNGEATFDERALDIVARRMRGDTLSEVAAAHGISRERVRQILRGHGVDANAALSARHATLLAGAEARREEILRAYRRGDRPEQIAREVDIASSAVRALLDTAITPADRAHRRANRHKGGAQQFSDEDLIAAVREVADRYGRTPTTTEYSRAAAGGMLPSLPLIHNRLGWRETVARAGLTPRGSLRREYHQRWTPEACRHALRRIVVETGEVPTVAQYETLAQLDDTLPSSATVRNRLGRWSTVTADLARLPTRADAMSRVVAADSTAATSEEIWLSYLDESLSHEDAIVLLTSGDLVFSPEFGPVPPELQDTVTMVESPPSEG
jgi:DNA-binding CsgD family transcriptional regulator